MFLKRCNGSGDHEVGLDSGRILIIPQHIDYMGVIMAMKAVWGFDPDEVERAQGRLRPGAEGDESFYDALQERTARLPRDASSQVYELRRLFRL